jgi:NADH:ubiquinone oxidoreductase subunit 3 (subunit A)
MEEYYLQYGLVMILMLVSIAIPIGMLSLSRILELLKIRPNKPSEVKLDIYECGMEAIGGRWVQFNFHYYLYALLFLIFDVAAVLVFPWAIDLRNYTLSTLALVFSFITILVFGWVYAWRTGALEWS